MPLPHSLVEAHAVDPVRQVPFFRPQLDEEEIAEVTSVLRSGWLTSGPMVARFERDFAESIGARYAVALNSGTAALHLGVEALGLRAGEGVLVPTMTFAATAEVVRYQGAAPILVDCDETTGNMDLADAARKLEMLRAGQLPVPADTRVKGIMPVHVGGLMMNTDAISEFAGRHGLWVVEDAAHAYPAAWRADESAPWRYCGQRTADVTCFSFYANKTITTGEGGMMVCDDEALANRIRMMALHGLSRDAWGRYSQKGTWDYRILAPGFKYNMPDPLAAIGVHQVAKRETLRRKRETIAAEYTERLRGVEELELPPAPDDSMHSWHLYPVRLRLDRLSVDRAEFIELLKAAGVGCSVHWRPLHLHPYYIDTYGWREEQFPAAGRLWPRLVTLPLFPAMSREEVDHVVETVQRLCVENRRRGA